MRSLFALMRTRRADRRGATTGSVVYAVPGAVGLLGLPDGEVSPDVAELLASELRRASWDARRLSSPSGVQ